MSAPLDERWYAPLVKPVLPAVLSALDKLDGASDPWTVPRTGLGGAFMIHVARGFGQRRWRRDGRVAVMALEAYNQRVHLGPPEDMEREQLLARDLGWVRKIWNSVLSEDGLLLGRVMDRVVGTPSNLGDRAVPEAVVFLRAAVAAGVVAGNVPDPVHAAFDRHATWLGLAWEANRGTLTEAGWRGALEAVGVRAPFKDDPDRFARREAARALEGVPHKPVVPLFLGVLENAPREAQVPSRNPAAWEPQLAPALNKPSAPTNGWAHDVLGDFCQRWAEPLESALGELVESDSTTMHQATEYVCGQGGKRVRPLLVLAAAGACGASPRRALPIAASVEWIHQGSLVLDDIIDDATLRRGAPPLHIATSAPFAAGVAAFLFARVLRVLHGAHPEIRERLVDAVSTLVIGERLELCHTRDHALSTTGYYRIIEAKTAQLFSCAAAVGGLAAEAGRRPVRALGRYGREIGLAFQIVDDLLDYTGSETLLGKRPGTDLRAGKMTLPLLFLRERLADAERERLDHALGRGEEFAWIAERLEAHEVPALCRERATAHVDRACDALKALPPGNGRELLVALSQLILKRRR